MVGGIKALCCGVPIDWRLGLADDELPLLRIEGLPINTEVLVHFRTLGGSGLPESEAESNAISRRLQNLSTEAVEPRAASSKPRVPVSIDFAELIHGELLDVPDVDHHRVRLTTDERCQGPELARASCPARGCGVDVASSTRGSRGRPTVSSASACSAGRPSQCAPSPRSTHAYPQVRAGCTTRAARRSACPWSAPGT
eukprot:scaffold323245_cov32-Tisochrysis_lutea.AAC.2